MIFSPLGDAFLARGMKHTGGIDIYHVTRLLSAVSNPFIILGILSLLIGMSSYMTAVSFADLSYVFPATAISYVVMVLLSIIWLHEHVSARRWTGVAFIVLGVGIVATGPFRTERKAMPESETVEKRI